MCLWKTYVLIWSFSMNDNVSCFYDEIAQLITKSESILENYIMPQAISSLLQYMISVLKIFQHTGLTDTNYD